MKLHEHEVCIILVVPVSEQKRGAVLQKMLQHLFPCFLRDLSLIKLPRIRTV
jgi:hypothetical protein